MNAEPPLDVFPLLVVGLLQFIELAIFSTLPPQWYWPIMLLYAAWYWITDRGDGLLELRQFDFLTLPKGLRLT